MKPEVNFDDWSKLDLRVAEIKEAEEIEGADKLYKLTVDVGPEIGERTICAGIKLYYEKEDLPYNSSQDVPTHRIHEPFSNDGTKGPPDL